MDSAVEAAQALRPKTFGCVDWCLPSRRDRAARRGIGKMPNDAPHSHRRSAIVSSTGRTSLGELDITRRMSAVAVCRSSASLRLVEQPHVLYRDHRLVGEGLEQLYLLVCERPHLRSPPGGRADRLPPWRSSGSVILPPPFRGFTSGIAGEWPRVTPRRRRRCAGLRSRSPAADGGARASGGAYIAGPIARSRRSSSPC